MMEQKFICKASDEGYIDMKNGILRKTLVFGTNTLMTQFRMERGSKLPLHRHPHEQTGYLVLGHIILSIGGQKFHINPGDSWVIPGNAEHGAEVLEDSVAVEVFSPVRADYLPFPV